MRIHCDVEAAGGVIIVWADKAYRVSIEYTVQMAGGHWTSGVWSGVVEAGSMRCPVPAQFPILSIGLEGVEFTEIAQRTSDGASTPTATAQAPIADPIGTPPIEISGPAQEELLRALGARESETGRNPDHRRFR